MISVVMQSTIRYEFVRSQRNLLHTYLFKFGDIEQVNGRISVRPDSVDVVPGNIAATAAALTRNVCNFLTILNMFTLVQLSSFQFQRYF